VTLARADNPALERLADIYFFLVVAPAMILAVPFGPLLWRLHLMETPGWFAWPRPAAFALVYIAWIAAFAVLSLLSRKLARAHLRGD
jgi:hypothetical protein